ncbi:plastocyanin/azurin family copper-binding protein [Halorubellus litoreus]|uniref:Plastocyanin/azurin family copper-binding protein n=1 Tax=Halorubellus litoreus TaxID=755308 RepID=A0ABD5VHC0_9EURY
MDRPTRRQVLASTGVAVATGVAGCSSGGEETTTEPDEETEPTETEMETTTEAETTTESDGPTTVVVGPNGDFRFAPSSVTIAVGDTVEWVWSSGGHNVVADSTPDGADWSGTEGAPSAVYDAGYEYSHTFEVAGTYAYYCNPHRGSGMTGEVVVEE